MREKLRAARKAQGLTQAKVANFVGIERTHYSRIERGDKRPSLKVAFILAELFGSSVEELFGPEIKP